MARSPTNTDAQLAEQLTALAMTRDVPLAMLQCAGAIVRREFELV